MGAWTLDFLTANHANRWIWDFCLGWVLGFWNFLTVNGAKDANDLGFVVGSAVFGARVFCVMGGGGLEIFLTGLLWGLGFPIGRFLLTLGRGGFGPGDPNYGFGLCF